MEGRVTPNRVNGGKPIINGHVTFVLLKPNKDKSKLETIDQYTVTQNDFVQFLKKGVTNNRAICLYDQQTKLF